MNNAEQKRRTVLIAGATGLIGGNAMRRFLSTVVGPSIVAVGRRPVPVNHIRLDSVIGDLSNLKQDHELARRISDACSGHIDVFLSALGTTQRDAGSKEAFQAIDLDLVLRLATIARGLDASHAIVVSSIGSNPSSGSTYLKTKGKLEAEIVKLGFPRCDFLRPSLLLGKRGGSLRLSEELGQFLAPVLNPFLMGRWHRFRAIRTVTVADALVSLTAESLPGRYVHEYDSILELARKVE